MRTPLKVTAGRLRVPVTDADHISGPADAPVTLVQYGDYQCVHCGAAHGVLRETLRRRPETVRLVFRHFPLVTVHPYAEDAAEVAEAAAARGGFWQMHDWLFEHQDHLDPVQLSLGVHQLGLPVDEIGEELGRHAHLAGVHRDLVGGIRSGVTGTPTFFLNGLPLDGPCTVADLVAAIDRAAEG